MYIVCTRFPKSEILENGRFYETLDINDIDKKSEKNAGVSSFSSHIIFLNIFKVRRQKI